MSPFENFRKWFYGKPTTGAELDTRPDEQKLKDFKFEEIVSKANPVRWTEKPEASWRKFPEQDQHRTYSCVAQTVKKMLGVQHYIKTGDYIDFSATHIYQRRVNKPGQGMQAIDAFDISRQGVTLEALANSEAQTDADMDAQVIEPYKQEVGKVFRISNYVLLPIKDIETVASVIQTTGKAVMIWHYFLEKEYGTKMPAVTEPGLPMAYALKHSIPAVDFTLINGRKVLVAEDSAHFGGFSRRLITEDFFKQRNFFAGYLLNFTFENQISPKLAPPLPEPEKVEVQKPKYTFSQTMQFSSTVVYLPDVKALQDCLKFEGLFPANVESTGYYGAVTAKAVLAFQKAHKIASDQELDELQGRLAGPKTLAKLNELYS